MAEQFDVTPEERKLLEIKWKRRTELRAEFLRKAFDPHRHGTGEGGAVVSKFRTIFFKIIFLTYKNIT